MSRRSVLVLFGLCAALFPLQAVDFTSLLRQADALVSFPGEDFSAEYTIVQDVPNQGRTTTVSTVFRRDSSRTYVIVILEPKINKGQGYLKLDQTLWFYDPQSRRFNSTRASERFQNSNARNSDFTASTLAEDYRVLKGDRVRLGAYDCWLLDMEAVTTEVSYPYMKLWVSDDGLVRKYEDYSLSKQLMRTTLIPNYQQVGRKFFPQKMLIIENLSGAIVNGKFVNEKTQITITNPSLKKLPDSVFSKSFLENISQ